MTDDAQHGRDWFLSRLKRHLSELAVLAGPIIVSRLAVLLIVIVDAMMVGHAGTTELAYLNLGNSIVTNLLVTGLGLLMGTLVLSSNAFGAGDLGECGRVWRRSLRYAVGLGLIGVAVTYNGPGLMRLLGQGDGLAAGAGGVSHILGLGVPAVLLYITTNFFLESIRRPLPGMMLMLMANVLNVGFNWVLVYGWGPVPPMGAAGAAWATTAVRYILATSIIIYVWRLSDRDALGIRGPLPDDPAGAKRQRRIGYATGLGVGAETTSFTAMVVFAGWLGELSAAAFGMAFSTLAFFFMGAIGVGAATTVRVGIAYGRRDGPDMALAGWTGLGVNTVLTSCCALFIYHQVDLIVSLFTTDPPLVALAATLIAIVAYVLVLDGGQAVMGQALRGRRDVWVPMSFQTVSYVCVMIPLGWYLSFAKDWGVEGLVWAIFIASIVSLILLAGRFHWLARRPFG
ncbi:MAG: MATE family efflux transporter [Rhodospirillaceae bacterium]